MTQITNRPTPARCLTLGAVLMASLLSSPPVQILRLGTGALLLGSGQAVADITKRAGSKTHPSAVMRGELPPGHEEGRSWANPHRRCTSSDGTQSGDVSVGPPGGNRCEYDRVKTDFNKGKSKN